MQFRTLGSVEVGLSGRTLTLGGAQQRAVLALLLINAPDPVSADRLIDELWGDRPPPTAPHAVQVHVSTLRRLLQAEDERVEVRHSASGYALDIDPEFVDARRFERLVEDAQRALSGDPSRSRALLEQALALWRGAPLADLSQFEFARREAARLAEVHAVAVECLVQARLACGEHSDVIPTLRRLVAAEPLREQPRRLLMIALYRCGRQVEALAAYREACAALDEVGLQPGPALRELETMILRHDPALQTGEQPVGSAVGRNGEAPNGATAETAPAGHERRRKIVTALCCDVSDSPEMGRDLDPEALLELTDRYFAELREIVERHGGTVLRLVGDAALVLFGISRVRDDDALEAVMTAAELRTRLAAEAEESGLALCLRAAINTGLALVDEQEKVVVGEAVGVANRLQQAADPGEILLGQETLELIRDAVEVEPVGLLSLKARSEPVAAFRLLAVNPTAPTAPHHSSAPLIGRGRELALLWGAWERTVDERGCHLFTLLGTAGVGKSRLVEELFAVLGDRATVLSGRCLHYGDGITFWPIAEALADLDSAAPVLERIAAGATASSEETFWDVRQVLEATAAERPVILHVDDLQWAEPMLLELLDHVAECSRGVPILLLCVSRPELLEEHPDWGGGKANATTATLEGLASADCELLLRHLDRGLPPETQDQVIAASGGNPLFLHELVALARERGTVTVPQSIQALLASRLERLDVRQRELLERGAIEGEVFHLGAVCALGDYGPRQVRSDLVELIRRDLIRRQPSALDDEAFRFRHILILDAAYAGLAKATRAELHERFATWLERASPALPDLDEIAGWHLEQVVRYQRELGRRLDLSVARRAAEALHAAGRRAAQRGDTGAARKLLERSHALAASDQALAERVALDLAEQLMEGDDLARVDALLRAAERNPETAAHAGLLRFHWLTLAKPKDAPPKIAAALPEILRQLKAGGDESGLAKAHLAAFWASSQRMVQSAEPAEQARLAAVHAGNAGDEGLRSRALGLYVASTLYGGTDPDTLAAKLDAVEREDAGTYVQTLVDGARGEVARLRGDLGECRRRFQEAVSRFTEMRIYPMASGCQSWIGWSELAGGDPACALPGLVNVDRHLAEVGERSFRATLVAVLAQVRERVGDVAGARDALRIAEGLAAESDHLTVVPMCIARARLATRQGDFGAAEAFARAGVDRAFQTDIFFLRADSELELARVLAADGRIADAQAGAARSLAVATRKGDRPRMREVRAFLDELHVSLGGKPHGPAAA